MPLPHNATWQDRARYVTDMNLAIYRQMFSDDPASIRAAVIGHAREALGPGSMDEMVQEAILAEGEPPELMIDGAGIFRLVLDNSDLNYRDPSTAESFMLVVQRRVDQVLGDHSLMAVICSGPKA